MPLEGRSWSRLCSLACVSLLMMGCTTLEATALQPRGAARRNPLGSIPSLRGPTVRVRHNRTWF